MTMPKILLGLCAVLASSLALAAEAQPSRQLTLQELRVLPDESTLRRVVEEELPLRPGDALDAEALERFEAALLASGRLDDISVYTEPGSERGQVVLIVEARLDRSAHLLTGLGHDAIDGWYLDLIGVRWSNPVRRGGEARLAFRAGQRSGGIHGRLEIPRILGAADFLLEGEAGTRQWRIHDGGDAFDQDIARGQLLLGAGWGGRRGWRSELWLGGSAAEPSGQLDGGDDTPDEAAGRLVPVPDGRERFGTAGVDLLYRGEASWKRGHAQALRLRSYRRENGDSYLRAELRSSLALPLPGSSALALSARGAAVGENAPYYDRLVFGGNDSVRGFRDASLSGSLGARRVWSGSAELRVPLLPRFADDPRVIGVLFADMGHSWDAELEASKPAFGVGYGLRIRVPWLQILRIDAGIPLSDEVTGDRFWVHSSLGFGF